MELLISGGQVLLDGGLQKCDIGIEKGRIVSLQKPGQAKPDQYDRVIDAAGKYVLPGSIDTHVHIRAPGGDHRETFLTGTMAAAAGGTTMIMEQPICNPTPYNRENLEYRNSFASKEAVVDYGFYGAAGCEYPEKIEELKDSGILAYKTFLQGPVPGREAEFTNLFMDDDAKLFRGMMDVAKTGKALMFHAENHKVIGVLEQELRRQGRTTGIAHVWSRPDFTETETIRKIISFAEVTGTRLIFAHVSTAEAMEDIRRAKLSGMEIYCETCVHYLTLTQKALEQFGPFAKCNPPVRDPENQKGLWQFCNDGYTVDAIGSDHSPFLYHEKADFAEDIFKAPPGLVGIDLRVPLMLDAVLRGKSTLENMVELLCLRPAKMLGIQDRKGRIAIGQDADLLIFDKKGKTLVDRSKSYSRSAESQMVYQGQTLKGNIDKTLVRGKIVAESGKVNPENAGYGQWIRPENSQTAIVQ